MLFREVRYVHTPAELLAVERAAKGKMDIVMGHVQVLGLPGKPFSGFLVQVLNQGVLRF